MADVETREKMQKINDLEIKLEFIQHEELQGEEKYFCEHLLNSFTFKGRDREESIISPKDNFKNLFGQ